MRVERSPEQRITQKWQAAIICAATDNLGRNELMAIHPERAPGSGVQRDNVVRALRHIHDPVHYERGRLPWPRHSRLVDPFQLERLRIRRSDLGQPAEALAEVAA